MNKCWDHIKENLKNILNGNACACTYYVGRTLCVKSKYREIALNLDGKGFIISSEIKNGKLYQPLEILELVRKIYLIHKGETDHYRECLQ